MSCHCWKQVEENTAQVEGEEDGPNNEDALYEEVRIPKKSIFCVYMVEIIIVSVQKK